MTFLLFHIMLSCRKTDNHGLKAHELRQLQHTTFTPALSSVGAHFGGLDFRVNSRNLTKTAINVINTKGNQFIYHPPCLAELTYLCEPKDGSNSHANVRMRGQ